MQSCLAGTVNWSVVSGTATLDSATGSTTVLQYANLSTKSARVRASIVFGGITYTSDYDVSKIIDGLNGKSVSISYPTQVFLRSDTSAAYSPSSITLTASAIGGTTVTYQWAYYNGTSWTNIGGATSASYTVGSGDFTNSLTYRVQATIDGINVYDQITLSHVTGTGSARIAYVKTTGTLSPTPTSQSFSGDVLPTTGTWGETNAWQITPPTISAGEQVWQTTGIYNYVTNQVTWVAPYLSNLKVGSLSAITTETGTLTIGATGHLKGGQTAYNTGTGFWLGYDSTTYKFSLGSSTQGITWDGSALNITGKLQIGTAGISAGAMTGSGAQINVDGTFALGTGNITSGSGGNGYDATGGYFVYNGTELNLTGIVKTSGAKGISFKAPSSTSANTGNFTRVAGTESLLQVSRYAGTSLPATYIYDASTGTTEALYVTNTSSFSGTSMVSLSCNKGNALFAYSSDTTYPTLEVVNATTTSVKGTAFFKNTGTGTEVSLGGGYPVYVAATKGKIYSTDGYLPFTGSHETLMSKDVKVDVGDIVCVKNIVYKKDINNVLVEVELSKQSLQKTRFGVICYATELNNEIDLPKILFKKYNKTHNIVIVNGLGEGQINVCGENGDIEAGDLIVTSNVTGKGMRGDDATPVNRIVAQALESVKFKSKDEVKMIACVYLCS